MRKRVLLIGVGPTTLSALESLAERFDVLGVVRDAAEGDPVAARAAELGAPLFADTSPAAVAALHAELRPDCTVISSYHRIIGPELLARGPFVNVHYAPLPQYRGRANVNWAIINGELAAAISVHTVAPGLDAGNLLFQARVPIGPRDTVSELYERLNGLQRIHLGAAVAAHLDGYAGEPQDEAEATYGCARLPADGLIDWSASTARVDALVRALAPPWPGAFTYLESRRLVVARAEPVEGGPRYVGRVPGRVVARDRRAGTVEVLTGDGALRLHAVLDEGGAVQPAAALITSTKQTLGLRSDELLGRIERLEIRVAQLAAALERKEQGELWT